MWNDETDELVQTQISNEYSHLLVARILNLDKWILVNSGLKICLVLYIDFNEISINDKLLSIINNNIDLASDHVDTSYASLHYMQR